MDSDIQTCMASHGPVQGYGGRIDVVTGPTGRRRWPEHVKAAMVLETFRDGVSVADVARRHDVSAPQLHAWRRAAREVARITLADVHGALAPLWKDRPDTGQRVRQRLERLFHWTVAAGHREAGNPALWSGGLTELLPAPVVRRC